MWHGNGLNDVATECGALNANRSALTGTEHGWWSGMRCGQRELVVHMLDSCRAPKTRKRWARSCRIAELKSAPSV
jgi:hypothetical protein